ncbi:magnesium chelatase subunit D family protein [Actinoplanes sp. NPDC026619]|uniref:magnesium chelatase subunit D family protein n=1 Tax=Actinoplanes sp. NPDC026619 TaxID=3155798 RepID=UPI0033FAFD2D
MTPYPFSAVVGLADLRLALLLNSVSPHVGGVLVRGEKGTAKSTVVRALASLLPPVDVVRGCRFACDPGAPDPLCPDGPHAPDSPAHSRPAALVELPVGATEDRVVGTLDIQRALADGVKAYEPGLLAAAHRGILYVDEVNLLPDHLVDLLLDAAAMGRAHVERDGVSVKHAARFLLVGTMNPEEGEPRPQLLDRFGLVVTVSAPRDAGDRAEVVRRRLAYEADPDAFAARFAGDELALAARIVAARQHLPRVVLPDGELDRIARVCLAYGVDGMRADIVVARCSVALAAWHGRDVVTADDVRDAARLALPHRRRKDPLDPPGTDEERLEDALSQAEPPPSPPSEDDDPEPDGGGSPPPPSSGPDGGPPPPPSSGPDGGAPGQPPSDAGLDTPDAGDKSGAGMAPAAAAGNAYRTRTLKIAARGTGGHAGRRSPSIARRGRVIGSRVPVGKLGGAPHLPATLRAALHRGDRFAQAGGRLVQPRDLREAVHVGREANLVLFVVDASGSMAARRRMTVVKTAVLSLLRDAYQRRDRVGMITFRGHDAEQVLPPTSSHEVGVMRLAALKTGGRTPLAAGLRTAAATIATERRRDPRRRPLLIIVTDGRATSGPDPVLMAPALAGVATVVVDCESGPVRLGLARRLATALDADLMPLDQLEAGAATAPGRAA